MKLKRLFYRNCQLTDSFLETLHILYFQIGMWSFESVDAQTLTDIYIYFTIQVSTTNPSNPATPEMQDFHNIMPQSQQQQQIMSSSSIPMMPPPTAITHVLWSLCNRISEFNIQYTSIIFTETHACSMNTIKLIQQEIMWFA